MENLKIFITGLPGCGKTTLIEKLTEKFSNKLAILTKEIRKDNRRVGFWIELKNKIYLKKELALISELENKFKNKKNKNWKRFGKYLVFPKHIDEIIRLAKKELEKGLEKKDRIKIIFVDEIGKMEFFSEKFKNFINEILKKEIIFVATLHRAYINKFKTYGKLIWLTKDNWKEMFNEIFNELIKIFEKNEKINEKNIKNRKI